ncbi:MAG: TonB-dependent receptor [Myxococcales bacterium]|nr:TonB-dependent receptor [Myxococcales bacterium]
MTLLPGLAGATGALDVFVFDGEQGDAPLAGAEVVAGEVQARTDARGAAHLKLPAGPSKVRITAPDRALAEVEVQITEGERAEVIVTAYADRAETAIEQRAAEAAPVVETVASGPTATLRGRAVDEAGQPIAGAQVFVRGRPEAATTDAAGRFTLALPQGQHALSIIHPRFAPGALEVALTTDDQSVEVPLRAARAALDDFVVSAPYIEGGVAELSAERRQTGNVVDVVGAEQMSRAGDSSAAGALGRVTGLTLVGGKYIYVRGMGERYSATTLNGQFLPSPEPERRVVPLDMFPTGILSAVVVQKSVSPDQPAEFGGGVVQLRTRRLPEEDFLEISGSLGFQAGTTFTDGPTYEGGALDMFGIDDGTRALPAKVATATDDTGLKLCSIGTRTACLQPADLIDIGRAFPEGWGTTKRPVPPDFGLSVAGGLTRKLGEARLGGTGSLSYGQSWQQTDEVRRTYRIANGRLEQSDNGRLQRLERAIELSGIIELGLDLGEDHQLAATTLLLRNTDDEVGEFRGTNSGERSDIDVTRLRWVERQVFTQQLRGEHALPADLNLRWHYGFSRADRLEPNHRSYQYDRGSGTDEPFGLSRKPEGNRRFYSDLDDTSHDIAAALRWTLGEHHLEAGAAALRRERTVETRRYRFVNGPTQVSDPIDDLFTRENIGDQPGQYAIANTTQATDDYDARQTINAGYALGEAAVFDLRLMAGLRVEAAEQSVSTFSPFTGTEPVEATLDDVDLLPSASLTWAFAETLQARASYGRSVNRPEFRELSPARFDDVTNRVSVVGNPDVERALIDHYDARVEWYPTPRESLSLGVFFKDFNHPIETRITPGADQTLSFFNATGGTNLGVELEARKQLDFVTSALADFYVAGNLALIRSRVDLSGDGGLQTSTERPLEGQSPYVLNVQVGYEAPEGGAHATLLYNISGERIVEVGTSGQPDVFEQPRHRLDFVAGLDVGAGVSLKLKAKNLLDTATERTQGGALRARATEGRSFSLGASWSL